MELTFALGDYAHTRTLCTGAALEWQGHTITVQRVTDRPGAIFRRAREQPLPFDVAEMSLATTYVLADNALENPNAQDFLALPVFPSRMLRHSAFYVRDPGLRPPDLRGKRLGVVRYGMTAAVWARALLATDYGIAPADVTWYTGERQFFAPDGVTLHEAPLAPAGGGPALEALLLDGALDCLISVDEPAAFQDGRLQRLFPDFRAAEREHFERTGLYPIMHCVLLRRVLAEREPWLPEALLRHFSAAKDEALAWLLSTDASALPLPFHHAWAREVRGLLGADPWPYGVPQNRAVLTEFGRLMQAQGLTRRALAPEDVFVAGPDDAT